MGPLNVYLLRTCYVVKWFWFCFQTPSDKTKLQQVDAKTKVVSMTSSCQYIDHILCSEGAHLGVFIQQKVSESRASMFSPILPNKKPAEDKRRNTVLSASKAKPAGKEAALFRPSVLSTRRINVR